MKNITPILWGIFICIILLGVVYITQGILGSAETSLLDVTRLTIIGKATLSLAGFLLILHSVWALGAYRGITFVVLSFMTGLAFEVVGVNYGAVFGGHYIYNPAIHPRIFNVPLLIPLIWAGFIYGGYIIILSSSFWLRRRRFNKTRRGIIHKAVVATLSALVVLSIDLVMEPLEVNAGNWRWLENGRYFNIPAGNFLGWFVVAFLSVFVFMILEDLLPQKREGIDNQVLLIPVLGYGLLGVILVFWALKIGMVLLAWVGLLAMAPTVLANLAIFLNWKTRIKSIEVEQN